MINAIFAADSLGGIGKNGSLPWPKNSEDLRWFKQHTFGHIVVMGGNTWRDPLMPKPLPGRINVVVTSQTVDTEGVIVYNNDYKRRLLDLQAQHPDKNIYIIGGTSLFNDARELIERVILTRFTDSYDCDVNMDLDSYLEGFELIEQTAKDSGIYQIWKKNI